MEKSIAVLLFQKTNRQFRLAEAAVLLSFYFPLSNLTIAKATQYSARKVQVVSSCSRNNNRQGSCLLP